MLYKSTSLRVKDLDTGQGIIQAYWSAFGNEDDGGDVVCPGAFTKSIGEWGPGARQPRIKYLYQHDEKALLGVPSELVQDDTGLLATAQIVKTALGQDVLLLYEAGVITEHSIGYETVRATFDPKSRARLLQELKLYEGSAVTWGMNSQTPTVAVKSLTDAAKVRARYDRLYKLLHDAPLRTELVASRLGEELKALEAALDALAPARKERPVEIRLSGDAKATKDALAALVAALESRESRETKGASGKADWPLGDRAAAWDNGEATKAIEAWADGDADKLASVHFWSPSGDDREDVSKYKLLYCDVVSGDVKAMPRGIFACAGSHGVDAADIPEGDKEAVRSKIEAYYARMAKQFDDPTIVAPWKDEGGKGGHMPDETKEPVAKPARRPRRPAKARDFQTIYNTDRDPWDLVEDLDELWEKMRECILGVLIEGAFNNGDNATLSTSLDQFRDAVTAWVQMAEVQECWGDIADQQEEAEARIADAYGSSYYGPWYYMALQVLREAKTGKPAELPASAKRAAILAAPDAPRLLSVKKGAQLSASNRDVLTGAANGMAKAMADMKVHHKALTDLLDKTLPQAEDEAATGETGEDAPAQNDDGKGGKSASSHTAPDRKHAGTTRESDALLSALDALLARHKSA